MAVHLKNESEATLRYVGWFHELDAWTEYWDIYHPETNGKYYFGDEKKEPGLLSVILPRVSRPPVFEAWIRMALHFDEASFQRELTIAKLASAIKEIDQLLDRLFVKYFGDASSTTVQADYLHAIFLFASNTLPPASERDKLIPPSDPRKATSGRHTLEGDIMWFAWALVLQASHVLCSNDNQNARRSLLLAGIAVGCPINFVWKGHRRTRPEYSKNNETKQLLSRRGMRWANHIEEAGREIQALYRIREWGSED